MERLTFEGNFCEIARCGYPTCPYKDGCSQKQVWERLKQYEDTKRTPEQIEALEAALMGKAVAQIMEFEGLPIARLRELAVADQKGRVIVLPCKVGQRVFALLDTDKHISECEIKQIGLGNEIGFVGLEPIGARGREYGVALNGFGKTVFLTREEAEKALAEMEGKKDG
jgi:hypothetical protein|nr:MAG TPA: Rtr1/RPAP2 family [Caudoviricetes sp.]